MAREYPRRFNRSSNHETRRAVLFAADWLPDIFRGGGGVSPDNHRYTRNPESENFEAGQMAQPFAEAIASFKSRHRRFAFLHVSGAYLPRGLSSTCLPPPASRAFYFSLVSSPFHSLPTVHVSLFLPSTTRPSLFSRFAVPFSPATSASVLGSHISSPPGPPRSPPIPRRERLHGFAFVSPPILCESRSQLHEIEPRGPVYFF